MTNLSDEELDELVLKLSEKLHQQRRSDADLARSLAFELEKQGACSLSTDEQRKVKDFLATKEKTVKWFFYIVTALLIYGLKALINDFIDIFKNHAQWH